MRMNNKVRVVTCPEVLPKDLIWSIFLAGGITGCPDWQQEFINLCKEKADRYLPNKGICLVNPRRDNFDVTDPGMSAQQIEWEYDHLRKCDIVIFWFPKETLCPITLFELGSALERNPFGTLIGCHPEYQRRFDVTHQTSLRRPSLKIADSIEELVYQLTGKTADEP